MTTAGVLSLDQLNALEMRQLSEERELSSPDPDIWRWSPLEIRKFAAMLEVAIPLASQHIVRLRDNAGGLRRITFGEAGAGIGTKLYLAERHYGLIAFGYEISEDYISKAREIGATVDKWDLREEHPPWAAYDIVYIARPFKDDDVESKWEREVMERMRPGSVLISAYAAVKPYQWTCYYRAPFRGVWVKPVSLSEGCPHC